MSDGGSSHKRFEDPSGNEFVEPPSGVLPFRR
jgi:hypothetical protein